MYNGATGTQGIETDVNLSYNPSTNTLNNIKAFSGTLSGNASSATTANLATYVTVNANNSTDKKTVYLTFVNGDTGLQGIETDTGLTYNPSSNILSAGVLFQVH